MSLFLGKVKGSTEGPNYRRHTISAVTGSSSAACGKERQVGMEMVYVFGFSDRIEYRVPNG